MSLLKNKQKDTPMQGYIGVFYSSNKQQYYIDLGGITYYNSIIEAATAYDKQAIQYYHECTILNYPDILQDYRDIYLS